MWLTPSSTARRSTATGCRRSSGAPSPERSPVSRIAPNPRRLTARSPSRQVPAASAGAKGELTGTGYLRETETPRGLLATTKNAGKVPFPVDAVSSNRGRRLRRPAGAQRSVTRLASVAVVARVVSSVISWCRSGRYRRATLLTASATRTYCPYKGDASYYGIVAADGERADAVWSYREPYDAVADIAGHVAQPGRRPDHPASGARSSVPARSARTSAGVLPSACGHDDGRMSAAQRGQHGGTVNFALPCGTRVSPGPFGKIKIIHPNGPAASRPPHTARAPRANPTSERGGRAGEPQPRGRRGRRGAGRSGLIGHLRGASGHRIR
jgi:Domain of unknown function (DUF427)